MCSFGWKLFSDFLIPKEIINSCFKVNSFFMMTFFFWWDQQSSMPGRRVVPGCSGPGNWLTYQTGHCTVYSGLCRVLTLQCSLCTVYNPSVHFHSTHMCKMDQDGYYKEKCHIFFTKVTAGRTAGPQDGPTNRHLELLCAANNCEIIQWSAGLH